MSRPLEIHTDRGIARVTLRRPEIHNALGPELTEAMGEAFRKLGADAGVRAIVLAAEGKSFCSGADLDWMRRMAAASQEENEADARALAEMFRTLYACPKPVIGRVQGAAFGGGVGLVAVCDLVAALDTASLCFSEVKLGLIPAVISPFVLRKVAPGIARRYFLTAERIPAAEARRIGLVSETAPDEEQLDQLVDGWCGLVRGNAPGAMAACKRLLDEVTNLHGEAVDGSTARRIAEVRASDEGREGLRAFLEKRRPRWAEDVHVP